MWHCCSAQRASQASVNNHECVKGVLCPSVFLSLFLIAQKDEKFVNQSKRRTWDKDLYRAIAAEKDETGSFSSSSSPSPFCQCSRLIVKASNALRLS